MSDNPFGRVITAMVTPMHDDGSIDFDGLQRLAVHLADHGHDGLLVNGTTGESATTTDDEDYDSVRAVVEAVGDRVSVMAGCGTNDTEHSMRAAREMVARGADSLLVVTPYYNKPTQHGIVEHFRMVAEAGERPVMVYDIPGRTGTALATDTIRRLDEVPHVRAVKDAKGDLFASSFVMNNSSLVYYSGEDALNLPLLSLGALGLVSVAGHVCSDRFASMVRAVANNDLYTARTLSRETADVVDALMNHMPGVISAKAALQAQGILDNRDVRMPLLPADEEQVAFVTAQLTRSGYLSE